MPCCASLHGCSGSMSSDALLLRADVGSGSPQLSAVFLTHSDHVPQRLVEVEVEAQPGAASGAAQVQR